MAHDVFISYSHKDKAVADAICAKLESEGARCWYAPRDIVPGANWAGAIIDAIREAKMMVLVFTDFSNVSGQVLREVSNAVSANVTIIPFKLTSALPTGDMQYYLATMHWLDAMDRPLEQAIDELSQRVCTNLEKPEPSEPQRTSPSPTSSETPRRGGPSPKLVGIVIAGIVLVAVVTILVVRGMPQSGTAGTPEASVSSSASTSDGTASTSDESQASSSTSGAAESTSQAVVAYTLGDAVDVYNAKSGQRELSLSVDDVHVLPKTMKYEMWESFDDKTTALLGVPCSVENLGSSNGADSAIELIHILQDNTVTVEDADGFLLKYVSQMYHGSDGLYPCETNTSIPSGTKGRFCLIFYAAKETTQVTVRIDSHNGVVYETAVTLAAD